MSQQPDANLQRPPEGHRPADGGDPPPDARPPREYPLIPPMAIVKTPYFHVLGYSVAGEESVIQIPELNINFDIGKCPRPALTADFCLLTHGHIDHSAGIPYYLSQRFFQGMNPGTILCPAKDRPAPLRHHPFLGRPGGQSHRAPHRPHERRRRVRTPQGPDRPRLRHAPHRALARLRHHRPPRKTPRRPARPEPPRPHPPADEGEAAKKSPIPSTSPWSPTPATPPWAKPSSSRA